MDAWLSGLQAIKYYGHNEKKTFLFAIMHVPKVILKPVLWCSEIIGLWIKVVDAMLLWHNPHKDAYYGF